jgi:precorrin-2 dehydrogenase/sirohydrochlorin ferrochelatase
MMKLLPVALNVAGKKTLVVGGGPVAARKVLSLLECDAQVTVIAPQLSPAFDVLRSRITYLERAWRSSDQAGQSLIFACTSSREVNAQIATEARACGIWCNLADDAEHSDFHGAAAIRRGEICVAITTGGGSPALAKHLKQEIEACIGEEYAQLLEILSARRAGLDGQVAEQSARANLWRAILKSDVLALLRAGNREAAEQIIDALIDATM